MKSPLFFLLLALSLASPGCRLLGENIRRPKVSLESVDVRDPDLVGGTLIFGIKVENPNDYALRVSRLTYDVELGGRPLTTENIDKELEVEGRQAATFRLPVRFRYADLFKTIGGLIEDGATSYRLKGKAQFGPIWVPFDERGKLTIENGKIRHDTDHSEKK